MIFGRVILVHLLTTKIGAFMVAPSHRVQRAFLSTKQSKSEDFFASAQKVETPSPVSNATVTAIGTISEEQTPNTLFKNSDIVSQVSNSKGDGIFVPADKEEVKKTTTSSTKSTVLSPEHARILQELQMAQDQFLDLDQADADRVFQAVAQEADKHRLYLAKLAVDETKMGCFEDKVLKNGLACELIYDRYLKAKTCGLIKGDTVHGTNVYANPVVRYTSSPPLAVVIVIFLNFVQ
mmetsp:Transcript_29374/g.42622  ORF Transcript_29374/g.42622 Transcript_29374/m.42622 type:complete len:236 (-) Transcript_29374:84-791(-)